MDQLPASRSPTWVNRQVAALQRVMRIALGNPVTVTPDLDRRVRLTSRLAR